MVNEEALIAMGLYPLAGAFLFVMGTLLISLCTTLSIPSLRRARVVLVACAAILVAMGFDFAIGRELGRPILRETVRPELVSTANSATDIRGRQIRRSRDAAYSF